MPPRPSPLDLLIVGGLTIDRFADGSAAPGGSVIHAAEAVFRDGLELAALTVAGDEPEAAAGLSRLGGLGNVIRQPARTTIAYRHGERAGRRVLVFERGTARIGLPALARCPRPDIALLAPIGDELPAATVEGVRDTLEPRLSVLLIQGWLRRLVPGREVEPLRLDALEPALWRTFADADAIVLSTEDLSGPADPFAQVAELRERLGRRPTLVLTLGTEGYVLDDPNRDRVIAEVPRAVVEGVPTVGAGDIFGAAFAVRLGAGDDPSTAARAASERVIAIFGERGGIRG
jgi:sugar/nucleoside kinase (ribokinase family)